MAAICPNEGKKLLAELCVKRILTNRDPDLWLGLFTGPASPGLGTVYTDLQEPSGTGYARKTLTDGSWTTSGTNPAIETYAAQTFTAGGTWSNGNVYGYFIATKGASPKIISIELTTGGPFSFVNTDAITVTPVINLS